MTSLLDFYSGFLDHWHVKIFSKERKCISMGVCVCVEVGVIKSQRNYKTEADKQSE